jgi:(p)ppGpp synthase/HD superfamily hydrolase
MKDGLEIISAARDLAKKAHAGQFRRDGTTPYFDHVHGVATTVIPTNPETIATAYLHDVLEDTSLSSKDLSDAGFPDSIVEAVLLLTKFDHQPYEEYLKAIKTNAIARAVKIADMKYNLADTPTEKQRVKYTSGIELLSQ